MKAITLVWGKALNLAVGVVLVLAFAAGIARAQITTVTANTTTTLWAGSQDTTTFGFSQFTEPMSGVILPGTAISAITGKPVRHMWYGDPLNGICRIDPEVDQIIPPTAGIGGHTVNFLTCLASIQGARTPWGPLTFDASTNTLYVVDAARVSLGVVRLHYIPTGDSGQGSLDIIHVEDLIGTQNTRNAFGACPQVKDPKNGTLVPVTPDSVALGPDGNLYSGSIRDGAILRINSPATFNPATDCPGGANATGVTPSANDKIQIPILSPDEALAGNTGHNFGLGFVGTTLLGADNTAPWILANAAQCFTSLNGNKICGSPALGGQAPMPTEILGSVVGVAQAATVSDAQYPTLPGTTAYFATFPSVTKVSNIVNATTMTVNQNYGGTFSFITGLTPDTANSGTLYVSADPFQGGINGAGQIWQVSPATICDCPPISPVITSAIAGPGNGQATLSWSPVLNGSPITSYVVQTLLAPAIAGGAPTPSTVPSVTIPAPTISATISGLTVGTSYVFEVQACNLGGCSPLSAPSPVVIPFSCTAPLAPTGVVAVAGNASATVAWTNAASCLAITSNTVSAFDSLAPTVVAATVTVAAPTNGAAVNGLINGHTYTFTVHATNSLGNSAESAPSLPITLAVPTSADMAITIIPPPSITAGTPIAFAVSVINKGPANASQVTINLSTSAASSTGAVLSAPIASFSASQGVCTAASVTSITCNLGAMIAGGSASVNVAIGTLSSAVNSVTASAQVFAFDGTGAALADPVPANNQASATVVFLQPPTTTDIQVTGSAQNGGPALGTTDTFTWQIKNNLGTTPANNVVFSSNMSAFSQIVVTPSQGTCSVFNNAIQCQLGTINGGATAIVTVNFNVGTVAAQFLTGGSATFIGTDTNPANNSFSISIQPK